MNIKEMHIVFRQYAQQMGMQVARAILDEQIDICLNTSISDTTNSIVNSTVTFVNDKLISDSIRIKNLNDLRTLYTIDELQFTGDNKHFNTVDNKFMSIFDIENHLNYEQLFWIDFSMNYEIKRKTTGFVKNSITEYYPVRFIDDCRLSESLHDYLLKPTCNSPIVSMYNTPNGLQLELHIGEFDENTLMVHNLLKPYKFRISYIRKPAVVKFDKTDNTKCVNCDLPNHLHEDIVKRAVDLYRTAVSTDLYSRSSNAN